MKKFLRKLYIWQNIYLKNKYLFKKKSYSAFGEDIEIKKHFKRNFNGFYVDVGCFHPKKYSNTFMLFKRGWFGINIDMEEGKIDTFNIARPKDYNFLGAISDKVEKVKIYRNQKFGVSSTIDPGILKKDDIIDENFITTTTLDNVINNSPYKNKEIDLLNIDTEGNDFKVLKSLNFNIYNPKVIIIETHLKKIEEIIKSEIYIYLTNKEYDLKSWNVYSLIFKKRSRT